MIITQKKLSELHKPARNIRRHSEKQLAEYVRSIKMFGQVKPLVVAEDGEIIAGNGLYEALLYGDPKLRILRILWTTIYNDHNAAIKEAQNGKH